jgi:hypothetical protein
MANEDFDALLQTMKKAAAALRDAGVPFMLGAGWLRGPAAAPSPITTST